MDENEDETENYIFCPKCEKIVPKNCKFCPYCGRRLFHPHVTPLLLGSAGLYFLNGILTGILFFPYLSFATVIEFASAIFIALGVKFAGYLGLMQSTVNTIFLIYLLTHFQNFALIIILIISHLLAAYLIIHEWEKFT